ncbi:MAG: DUF3343 domain-containing protein [Clostridium sp.]|jgi:hypothetical protein|nr:DUF3343 domain-containing protein [Clostridium sp.]
MEYYIFVYKNTFDAMNAEKKLNEKNFDFKIMPTPTSMTQSCGICTRFESLEEVNEIIENSIVEYKHVYHRNRDGFEMIK